jgi:hypothetical protein
MPSELFRMIRAGSKTLIGYDKMSYSPGTAICSAFGTQKVF